MPAIKQLVQLALPPYDKRVPITFFGRLGQRRGLGQCKIRGLEDETHTITRLSGSALSSRSELFV